MTSNFTLPEIEQKDVQTIKDGKYEYLIEKIKKGAALKLSHKTKDACFHTYACLTSYKRRKPSWQDVKIKKNGLDIILYIEANNQQGAIS